MRPHARGPVCSWDDVVVETRARRHRRDRDGHRHAPCGLRATGAGRSARVRVKYEGNTYYYGGWINKKLTGRPSPARTGSSDLP